MKHAKQLIFILLFLFSGMAQAQVDKFDISASSNSIIRVVDETYVLIYTQQSVDTGTFLLYQLGDSTALAFRVPNKWEIRDVRIHNGTDAYFCGTRGGTGLIGKFSIWPMFAGTGSISYILCDWTANKYVYPTDLKRLALFEDGGKVCMAMTGSSLWHISHMLPNTTVMSAYWDASGNCNYHCFCNKDMSMSFTDVACLDEVIVAVGTDPQGEECYMKTFGRQDNFPMNPIDHGKKISIDFERPMGDVLAEYKEGNTVVLSQYNKITSGISTVLYRTEVSPTTGRPTTTAIDTWHLLEYDDDDDSKVMPSHGDPAPIFQVDVNMSCE